MRFFCIPSSLFACRSGLVEQLDFSQLRLEHVPREIIKSRKHIEELLLNVNSIEELPSDLFRRTKICRLDVSENKIKVIPAEIGSLQTLEWLNLSKNEVVEIPEEIGLCQNLTSLDISTNIVTGFPKSFVNLTQLSSLNLSNNSLTQLPQDIDKLVNLQFLDVAQCELRFLPASIVRLEKLRILDLCDNYLTELPSGMNGLASLEMLDLHCNMIGSLPAELLRCKLLRSLDMSGNQLSELPSNIGELHSLSELVLCDNQIRQLPSSIGRLKKLEVLKAAKNNLAELTPSICSCSLLTDLILCENQLSELPASVGNLRRLRFLDMNVNNLHSLPPTIGGCQSLAILSLRHNQISELPMEIGKLNQLQVLDVADNNLTYLPYTLTVLYQAKTLSALWLAFNQPSLPKLSTTNEPVMNVKVLTCYLLPQKGARPADVNRPHSKSCVGGARVCFAGEQSQQQTEEEDKIPLGKFERYDTPHPKPFAPKNRHSRNSGDFTALVTAAQNGQIPDEQNSNGERQNNSVAPNSSACLEGPLAEQSRPLRSVLKRRPQSVLSHISTSDLFASLLDGAAAPEDGAKQKKLIRKNIRITKGPHGFQWNIVGGADSMPYKGKAGLFVSHLVADGAAQRAGFCVDDCLLAVCGQDLRGLTHQAAIHLIQQSGEQLDFLVERGPKDTRRSNPNLCYTAEPASEEPPPRPPERISSMIVRDGRGLSGFSVTGSGRWPEDPFCVANVDSAECSLQRGDRIVSVGGINLKFGARLDQVKLLLTGLSGTRVEVVVERGGEWPPRPQPRLPPKRYAQGASTAFGELALTRSLPSLLAPLAAAGGVTPHASAEENAVAVSALPPLRQFQREPSVRAQKLPDLPVATSSRSMNNLGPEGGENSQNGVKLRASTPIEYPPGQEPPLEGEQPMPASTSFSVAQVCPPPLPPKAQKSNQPNGLQTTIEPPLATSSPIPAEQRRTSHIPVVQIKSGGTAPPPLAPKPKMPNGGTSSAQLDETEPSAAICPPTPASSSFSSKLKHFEELQQQQRGTASKPSGIPLKKPLVGALELEKMREEEGRREQAESGGEAEADEHRDTLHELTRLLSSTSVAEQQHNSNGPSVVRTKKAEVRALHSNSSFSAEHNNLSDCADESSSQRSLSRADSSLSQRAAEIEKRREWRQARLQSMDVESKRTDDLVKLIANATAEKHTAEMLPNTPSPIPIVP